MSQPRDRVSPKRWGFGAIASIVIAALSGGCTAAPPPEGVSSPPPSAAVVTPSPTPEVGFSEYFSAVAKGDPVELSRVATELTVPGSNAFAYATEQAAVAQAYRDSGQTGFAQQLEQIEGGYSTCGTFDGELSCTDFTELEASDGRLADFLAGGTPLDGRLAIGSGDAVALGALAQVEFLAAYRSVAGIMWVIVEVRSEVDGLSTVLGRYKAPDGRQADPTGLVGPIELSAGGIANYAFAFDGAAFGGVLTVSAYDRNFAEASVDIPTSP